MVSLEVTDESSLSDGIYKLNIKTAIGQFPLHKSIFHLFKISISRVRMAFLPQAFFYLQGGIVVQADFSHKKGTSKYF